MSDGRRRPLAAWAPVLALVGLLALGGEAEAQRMTKKELRKLPFNHPAQCPHTQGDPELLAQMGILSTGGGFEFGAKDTAETEELLPTARILWAETEHFRLGFALGEYKLSGKEKRKITAELEELSEILPDLNTRMRSLDPWMRLYLTARRLEKVWDRFLEIVQVEEGQFPKAGEQYLLGTPYFGMGPYAGMKGKYEVLVVPSEAQLTDYLSDHFGLQMKYTQRWHHIERGVLSITCHERQGSLRVDEALHAHLAFNVTANLLDGFKHYAFDLPIWLREGLAHFVEREVSERYNSFQGSEGVAPLESRKEDWDAEVVDILSKGDAPRLSELMSVLSYGDLDIEMHYVVWSMTRFMIEEDPDGYACLIGTLSALLDEEGYPDGSNMDDHHRDAMRECLGLTYAQFDEAWSRWALGTDEDEEEDGSSGG